MIHKKDLKNIFYNDADSYPLLFLIEKQAGNNTSLEKTKVYGKFMKLLDLLRELLFRIDESICKETDCL